MIDYEKTTTLDLSTRRLLLQAAIHLMNYSADNLSLYQDAGLDAVNLSNYETKSFKDGTELIEHVKEVSAISTKLKEISLL